MVRLAVEKVGPEFCGGCGLLRGGELFLISISLSLFLSIWWVWLCLTFRPVRLHLLRPRRFCWLLRSLKDRRSLISHFLMTDSICHSSLPCTVLEKVTLTTIQLRIYPRTEVDPMFQCVYISTPLKSCPYKSSATCAWSMARVAEKPALIYVWTTKAQISLRICTGWSAPLLFAIARFFFSTKKRLTNLNGEQNDTGNLLVSHRICHFRAIQPFDCC